MKPASWLSLLLIPTLVLVGCKPVNPTIQPTQETHVPSPINLPVTDTVLPTSTPTLTVTETFLPTATQTLLATLDPKSVKETVQPLLQDSMNCAAPCFWGITPGKTSMDKARAFFGPLGFTHREGTDPNSGRNFYSVAYESSFDRDSYVTLYTSNSLVENITVTPEITKQIEGSPRDWIAYSPETLIKKYGEPSRVEFALDWGPNFVIVMIMYFYDVDLIALYSGYNMIPDRPHSPQLCPLTAPFDHVRLWMGPNPPDPPLTGSPDPLERGIPLEEATSLTIDQFTQLMLGDPQQACFVVNGDSFQ
ncbi:MAG: hypothetical protein WA109_13455 [Bellilinea sp.]